ncbi:MAG: DUF6495 family protein [Saprospiraceae bacterium]|nr:DUF6495 family protein [Saprospiraceae bacterium]
MRFRRLTEEELTALKEDFIQFLASNQITANEWLDMKAENADKVHDLIDMFSEIVLEKVFGNLEYLQHRTKDTIRVFYCQKDKITMTGLQITDPSRDLTNPKDLEILSNPDAIQGKVKVFQMDKKYSQKRPDEVYSMMSNNGCQPAPKGMFDLLVKMYSRST